MDVDNPLIGIVGGNGRMGTWLTALLKGQGFEVLCASRNSDPTPRMMGLIQGVNHFSTLALAWCIRESGFDLEDIMALSTQTFLERLDRIGSITKQPGALFKALLMDNSNAMACIHQYEKFVNYLNCMIKEGEKSSFECFFKSIQKTFNGYRENKSG